MAEVMTPGGFESFASLAAVYGLTCGSPGWLDDVVVRYRLRPPAH
jgi:hypothetical protein